jgi:hypothetical protein
MPLLAQVAKPRTMQDVCGLAGPKEIAAQIIKKPQACPRVFIFHGESGTGKSILARICAAGANCAAKVGRPCGKCGPCVEDEPGWYREFDTTTVTAAEDWQMLRDSFFEATPGGEWRFLVFEEFGAASKGAQATFIKALDEVPDRVTVILTTTDVGKIIPQVRSRAVEVAFNRPTAEEARSFLIRVINSVGAAVSPEALEDITERAPGRLREAIHLLDVYLSVQDPEAFSRAFTGPGEILVSFLRGVKKGVAAEAIAPVVQELLAHPLPLVRDALFDLVNALLEGYAMATAPGSIEGTTQGPQFGSVPRSVEPGTTSSVRHEHGVRAEKQSSSDRQVNAPVAGQGPAPTDPGLGPEQGRKGAEMAVDQRPERLRFAPAPAIDPAPGSESPEGLRSPPSSTGQTPGGVRSTCSPEMICAVKGVASGCSKSQEYMAAGAQGPVAITAPETEASQEGVGNRGQERRQGAASPGGPQLTSQEDSESSPLHESSLPEKPLRTCTYTTRGLSLQADPNSGSGLPVPVTIASQGAGSETAPGAASRVTKGNGECADGLHERPLLSAPGTPHALSQIPSFGTEGLVPLWGKDAIALLAWVSTEWATKCLTEPARFPGFLWSLFLSFRKPMKSAR